MKLFMNRSIHKTRLETQAVGISLNENVSAKLFGRNVGSSTFLARLVSQQFNGFSQFVHKK